MAGLGYKCAIALRPRWIPTAAAVKKTITARVARGRWPVGRTRSIPLSILWAVLTVGIYTLVWTYRTQEEVKRYSGNHRRLDGSPSWERRRTSAHAQCCKQISPGHLYERQNPVFCRDFLVTAQDSLHS